MLSTIRLLAVVALVLVLGLAALASLHRSQASQEVDLPAEGKVQATQVASKETGLSHEELYDLRFPELETGSHAWLLIAALHKDLCSTTVEYRSVSQFRQLVQIFLLLWREGQGYKTACLDSLEYAPEFAGRSWRTWAAVAGVGALLEELDQYEQSGKLPPEALAALGKQRAGLLGPDRTSPPQVLSQMLKSTRCVLLACCADSCETIHTSHIVGDDSAARSESLAD